LTSLNPKTGKRETTRKDMQEQFGPLKVEFGLLIARQREQL
jgi:hypothetical protein